ncbi:hypothetical protein GSY74_04815 [Sulfurovum sp. bin170]|uniref:hypothetical protein n=1 Tax=Sulfurovum sp. bin170 TaxID=2695268 RepID=UPI0013E0A614|nr:hypothetical protein [Sulfurovum sp. bin170]NEW60598.1 hypothetical protein [Sulfurovum sp. bin170]
MYLRFNITTVFALIVLFFMEGCTPKKITIGEDRDVTVESQMVVVEEVAHDKKYQKLMGDLDYLLFTKLDSEFNRDEEWIVYNKKPIISVLDEFISNSQKIQTDIPLSLMTDEYMGLAKSLAYKANFLKKLVQNDNVSKMDKGVSILTSTCNSCHAVYSF